MSQGQQNQNIKQKQYCNKFNKDFKNGPHQKKNRERVEDCSLNIWPNDSHGQS